MTGKLPSRSSLGGLAQFRRPLVSLAVALAFLLGPSACETPTAVPPVPASGSQPEPQTISEGDVLKIEFPGSPNLDTTQQVRRDGRISMAIVGEVVVVGMTPARLEKHLVSLYSTQLVSKEVTVTVVSSSFSVFVTGAVVRPGKIQPDHPITALEAVMEAGGFITDKADAKAVVVVRQENGGTRNYKLNLKDILDGKTSSSFYLKPFDIVYVPEKFNWF
jgi:polysaccharide export outer membrane protein